MRNFGSLLSHDITGNTLNLRFENGDGMLQVITADIIRVFSQLEEQPTFSMTRPEAGFSTAWLAQKSFTPKVR